MVFDRIPPRGYHTPMKATVKKGVMRRLKIAEGQVRGLQKMVSEDAYCIDIITQASAIRHLISAVEDLMLENHLGEHVVHQMQRGQGKKATDEIMKVYKVGKKR